MPWSESLLSLLWMLLCVVVIIVLAYVFTRYVAGRGGWGYLGVSGRAGQMKVLARLPLGRDQAAVLIQVGERYLLLGVAPSGVSLLTELTPEEAQALCDPPPADKPAPLSFREALRTVVQQRKQR